jgi:hypothetical protein
VGEIWKIQQRRLREEARKLRGKSREHRKLEVK